MWKGRIRLETGSRETKPLEEDSESGGRYVRRKSQWPQSSKCLEKVYISMEYSSKDKELMVYQ